MSDGTGQSERQSGSRVFQCGTCQQRYSRLDHLARHVRSHTREKPYICPVCSKGFSRTDLLKRHAAGHEPGPEGVDRRKRKRLSHVAGRVSQACNTCAVLHLKCEEEKPCRRCQSKDIPCNVMQPPESTEEHGVVQSSPLPRDESGFDDALETESRTVDRQAIDTALNEQTLPIPTPDPSSYSNLPCGNTQLFDLLEFAPSIPGHLSNSLLPDPGSGTWTPRSVMDFGLETNLELNEMDLNFLDTYNVHVPFDNETPSDQPSSNSIAGIGTNAFRESVWRFIPVSQHPAPLEREDFDFPTNGPENSSMSLRVNKRATSESLPQTSRDHLLAMFLSRCKRSSMARLANSFPSAELLDNLLQYYLTSSFSDARTWLHIPTFSPSKIKSPELLTGMIAAGAVLTPDSALIKLGFVFQEVLRTYLSLVFEEDNSKIRELHVLQAFMLQIEIGLWSGNSRKIEIAESFQQPLLTMFRRAGKFRGSAYETIIPESEDEGGRLQTKWNNWIHQESYKRLAFHLFQHDTHASIALSNNPLVSYAEMHLPLPAHRDLWLADTAEKWKTTYLSGLSGQPIVDNRYGLVDCMKEVELFRSLSQVTDSAESDLAFLYAIWRLIWEYKQFNSITKGEKADEGLVMRSRYQDLISTLQTFRISSDEQAHGGSRSTLILELILMHLRVSLEDIQLFAGLEGHTDATRVYPSLCEWVNTQASRHALWHAGQIIRVAKSMPPRRLRDFAAIAVYHASLTFWAYGVISSTSQDATRPGTDTTGIPSTTSKQPVWLDEQEGTDTQRFRALGRGLPGISGVEGWQTPAFLDDPGAVIDIVVDILKRNHEMGGEQQWTRPPLVENLVKLMRGLRNAMKGANM